MTKLYPQVNACIRDTFIGVTGAIRCVKSTGGTDVVFEVEDGTSEVTLKSLKFLSNLFETPNVSVSVTGDGDYYDWTKEITVSRITCGYGSRPPGKVFYDWKLDDTLRRHLRAIGELLIDADRNE